MRRLGPQSTRWAEAVVAARGVEAVRVLIGLLSLAERHPVAAIERACGIASGYGAYHLRTVRALIDRDAPKQEMMPFMSEHPDDPSAVRVRPVRPRRVPTEGDSLMNDALRSALKKLRLSGLLESLEVRLQEAAGHGLSHVEFLELILQDELAVRSDRQLQRRVKAALFRELKPLDQFDWSFNPSIKKKQVLDLATCRFVREKRDVLWLGPPGVGKSFLVQAIGYQAIKAGHVVLYRSIFDVVRDFLHDEALSAEDKVLVAVPQAGPADHRRHGDEAVAEAIGRVSVRDHHAAVRDAVDDDDLEPAAGGLGQAARRRAHARRRSWTGSCTTRRWCR